MCFSAIEGFIQPISDKFNDFSMLLISGINKPGVSTKYIKGS